MNFKKHTNALATIISKSLGVLCKLHHILPIPALRNFYYSMIHSHLLYGITVWRNAFDKYLKRLATFQNKAVKLISGAQWRDHVTPSYLKLQILKLNGLYLYEVAKLMYKHTRKKLPIRSIHILCPGLSDTHTKYSFSIIRIKSLPAQIQISKITKKFYVSRSQDLELGATRHKRLPFN